MNLQIHTFYDEEFSNIFQRDLKRARSKTCPISKIEDFAEYYEMKADTGANYRLRNHVNQVLCALDGGPRRHRTLSNAVSDNYNEIEKLGTHFYFDSYCVLLSLDDHLDLVMNMCCGADPSNVRRIPKYNFVSFNILNVCARPEDNICLASFRGFDKNLDAYIKSCFISDEEDEPITDQEALRKFFSGILDSAANILTLVAMNTYKVSNLSLRSQGFSNFVFGALSDKQCVPECVIYHARDLEVKLPFYKLERREYLDLMRRGVIL